MSVACLTHVDFSLEALPTEVFDNVVDCLLGWDLFYLSHASPWLLQALNREEIWLNRVIRTSQTQANAKREYVQASSWCFQGQRDDSSERASRGGGIKVDSYHLNRGVRPITFDCAPGSFRVPSSCRVELSFDTWFALLPPPKGVLPGGILFGEQSEARTKGNQVPAEHKKFVHIDKERNLYCSLLTYSGRRIARNLEYNRWYHLALSYDGSEERVFLDGDLMNTKVGWFVPWQRLGHAQIGTGYMGGPPSNGFNNWYGFIGAIYDFRFWKHALTAEEVMTLANGGALDEGASFSLLHLSKDKIMGSVTRTRSSSPVERVMSSQSSRVEVFSSREERRSNPSCVVS